VKLWSHLWKKYHLSVPVSVAHLKEYINRKLEASGILLCNSWHNKISKKTWIFRTPKHMIYLLATVGLSAALWYSYIVIKGTTQDLLRINLVGFLRTVKYFGPCYLREDEWIWNKTGVLETHLKSVMRILKFHTNTYADYWHIVDYQEVSALYI